METSMSKTEKKKSKTQNEEFETVQNAEVIEEDNTLLNQLNEEKDKFLRLAAEFDNFKKRTVKEKEAIYYDCIAESVKAILPVADNLERALNSGGDYEALKKGVEMVLTQLFEGLKTLGVEEINNEVFDPNLHNAVMHIEDEEKGEGEIVESFQKGYKVRDKVIRHSMVKVAN
jgi:molecular chaperone GrpE